MSLPTFGVRELHGPSNLGLVTITRPQYDSTIRSHPDSTLSYLDPDDGETITVGSGLELQQRLEEPCQSRRLTRRRTGSIASLPDNDQKIHIFDIQHTTENLSIWRAHAAYANKPSAPQPLSSLRVDGSNLTSEQDVTTTSRELPIIEASPSASPVAAVPMTESPKNILDDIDQVLQTACRGLENHIGGFASFLDMTAAALQSAAQKTRDADTTPVETLLTGLKNVLGEAKEIGLDLLREIDLQMNTPSKDSQTQTNTQTITSDESAPTVKTDDDSESNVKKVVFAENYSQQPSSPIFSATFKRQADPLFGSAPAIENLLNAVPEKNTMPYRSFPNRPAAEVRISPLPAKAPMQQQSLIDDDSANADFAARFPPLASLKRARTISTLRKEANKADTPSASGSANTALTRYPSIGQLESRRNAVDTPHSRHWRRLTAKQLESGWSQDATKDRSLRGYRKPTVEDAPRPDTTTKEDKVTPKQPMQKLTNTALPGSWPDRSSIIPDASFYESSGEFFDRMAAAAKKKAMSPVLSCRNTSPPEDFLASSTTGLRRAQTVTASNPAARLNGPFDPMNVAPASTLPKRSLTQHQPRPQPVSFTPAVAPRQPTLWNNFNRQVPMLDNQMPPYAPANPSTMPGAFPYPPVPQAQVQSIRHMRSEPNFGLQPNVDVTVNECVKTLKIMGYGSGSPYEASRLPIYAGAAAGDVLDAIEMLEEDRRAAKDMMA